MRPRPRCTEAYLETVSRELKRSVNDSAFRGPVNDSKWWLLGPFGAVAGLLGFIWLLLFWLPSFAPEFGREVIDPANPRYTFTIGKWYDEILPDGTHVRAHYMGKLAPGQVLPHADIGDEYAYQGNYWIWMIPAGKAVPEWVDP